MAAEVPVAPHWRRSSFCANVNCVEVAALGETVAIRESHSPDGPVLVIAASSWQRLLTSLKDEDRG